MDPEERAAAEARVREEVEAEVRAAYDRRLSGLLTALVLLATVFVVCNTLRVVPPLAEVYEQMKVPMPVMTTGVLSGYAVVALFLSVLAAAGAAAHFVLKNSRLSYRLNVAALIALGLWVVVALTALYGPLLSLLQGLGGRP